MMRLVNLLLMLTILVAVPLQSVSGVAFAASTTSSSSSTTSDESIDDWMPDKTLQGVVLDALKDSGCSVNTGTRSDLTLSEITPAMLADLRYLNTGAGKTTHITGITDLTGLQYATGLQQFNFSGSMIEKAPGDDTSRSWSVLANANYSNLGFIDVNSKDIDLTGLANLDRSKVGISNIGLSDADYSGITPGPQVTKLIEGQNITYNPVFSKREAYIPLSNWYPGFMNSDGTFTYHTLTTGLASAAYPGKIAGVEYDSDANRLKIDFDNLENQTLNISDFDIKDVVTSALAPSGTATYYSGQNSLDATIPEPTQKAQTVQVSQSGKTGSIDTTGLNLGTTDASGVQIQVPTDYEDSNDTSNSKYLTADDISFDTSDLASGKINFTLTASGLKKLSANDLTSDVMITVDGKVIDLTLTVTAAPEDWMPDPELREQVQKVISSRPIGDGTLTKANLAQIGTLDLTGVSNLTGLEYASGLYNLNISNSDLYDGGLSKGPNSQVLSKLTGLGKIEIDKSDLGGSLADWGLKDEPKLNSIIADNDNLTNPGTTDYSADSNLLTLKLTNNPLAGDINQLVLDNNQWTKLTTLSLNDDQLTGDLPKLANNSLLENLYLKNNQLTGTIPDSYGDLPDLIDFQLDHNQLSGTLPAALGQAKNLSAIYLNNNHLSGTIPTNWSDLQSLTTLDLAENQLGGTLDDIDSFTNLSTIYLNNNEFIGELPAKWFTSKLTYFEASQNYFSGSLPDLSKATNLTTLSVHDNKLTGDLPDLSNLPNLTLDYGKNQITSGWTAAGASGNYQAFSIEKPNWQTSSDGKTMTLDLSQYYHGEQGQTGYQYLGWNLPSGETGIALDQSDSKHPLLKIDKATTNAGSKLELNLYDQAGSQAVLNSNMNYEADITIPVDVGKTYGITTNAVDFGSHPVGTGIVKASDFNLAVNSTRASGDSYQLTAQTAGLTASGHDVPLYYGNGQHQTLLTDAAQSIYDYQPTSDSDTTVVGNSQDSTKGNLQTDIPSTAYAGQYSGNITYTLASAPASDSTTTSQSSDVSQITAATLNQMTPTIAAATLPVEEEAMRAKLQTNMTNFVGNELADNSGVLYSGYLASQGKGDNPYQELSETNGLWLLALAESGDETSFDTSFNATVKRFYDDNTQTFNWQVSGVNHDSSATRNASVDDLRIIQALLVMNAKHPSNDRTLWINKLIDGFTKHDLNAYYQMIDSYSTASGQEKKIRLDYLDLATLKAIYEAKRLGTTTGTSGGTAYQQQLKLIKDSYISDKLPMFATYYDYSTGNYQFHGDTADDQLNITDGLLTMLNLAKVGELPQTSLNWLLQHTTTDEKIYNNYNLADGTAADGDDAPSNYAYVAQIAVALSSDPSLHSQAVTLYSQALAKLNEKTTTDPTHPELDGSAQANGESYAFNDLNMLLAYNSVAFGTTSTGE
ncbi:MULTISPECIES: hypothetical protein [Lactobacillaceae]|uniref:hypothetical protein n=2 Tax=Lactobacillales TaxID=186826 RepID=UPI00145765B5|nr:hypothetical protein [Lactobacillus sp. HBUAS51381]NLR10538.1 hypothetical protein [Lactobacillus sp. HBUAS51381]